MPEPIKIEEHTLDLIESMPTQFRDKTNIETLLNVWGNYVQEIEDHYFSIFEETRFFEASGVNLDRYGFLLGLKRPAGMVDSEFRSIIAGEIVARASDSTMDSIRTTIEAVTGMERTNIIDINNTVEWRNSGYPKLTGDVMVYGYYTRGNRRLSGYEGELLKKACPVTTEVSVYGEHIQLDPENNNLWIPCEVKLLPDPVGVESPLGNSPLDELVTDAAGTDNLAVSGTRFDSYGVNWELGILPEDSSGGGSLVVETDEGFDTLNIQTSNGTEVFEVQTEGIENNHGVLLEISYSEY